MTKRETEGLSDSKDDTVRFHYASQGVPAAMGGSVDASISAVVRPTGSSKPSTWVMVLAYVLMIIATITFGAVGPAFLYVQEIGDILPLTAASWRNQICLVWFVPIGLVAMWRTPAHERKTWFASRAPPSYFDSSNGYFDRFKTWMVHHTVYRDVMTAGFCWAGSLATWVPAVSLTTTVRAALYANLYPFIVLIYSWCIGKPSSRQEVFAMFISLIGVFISELGPLLNETSANGKSQNEMLMGDLLCIGTACFNAANLVAGSSARKTLPTLPYTMFVTIISTFFLLIMSWIEQGTDVRFWQRDSLMGWVSLPDEALLWFLAFGFGVGIVGMLSWNFCIKFVPPTVSSSCRLTDPAITGVISWAMGIEGVPAVLTWVGGGVVMIGLAIMAIFKPKQGEATAIVTPEIDYLSIGPRESQEKEAVKLDLRGTIRRASLTAT